ncbi:MAG: MotA/TolQ/ExbB proton channel family protein [Gemmatimonadaceae bacterium]|nr:MotA/TolQ/ExbB proton channel family protein [Gemmatimonadaceae bacterium]
MAGPSLLVAQAAAALPTNAWELITTADVVTQVVLALLLLLSIISWSIMAAKWREFRRYRRTSHDFMHAFERARSLAEVAASTRKASGPFVRIFERAETFLSDTPPAMAATPERSARFSASQVEALRLVLDAQTDTERDGLSRLIPSLAMIASASPLIGLLGTVLGIIQSFIGLSTTGSGSVAAVAPGVAAALTATAMALAVAIPAVFGYNIFANRVNRIEGELEGFGSELIALLVREGRI